MEGAITFRPSMPLDQTASWMDQNGVEMILVITLDGPLSEKAQPDQALTGR
jgi:hypothetical protein